jgi:hypothetical protein
VSLAASSKDSARIVQPTLAVLACLVLVVWKAETLAQNSEQLYAPRLAVRSKARIRFANLLIVSTLVPTVRVVFKKELRVRNFQVMIAKQLAAYTLGIIPCANWLNVSQILPMARVV